VATSQVLRREGEFWTLAYEGRVTRIADARGLHHLARLLANPGQEVHALDLAAGADRPRSATTDAGPVLDAAAKAAYRARVTELREELTEAEAFADTARMERARAELDALTHELASAAGLGGRDRRAADDAERARVSVTKAIRSALRRIAQHDPGLAEHLDRTVHTGIFCSYQPDPRLRAEWGPGAPTPAPSLGTSDTTLVGRADEQAALRTFLSGSGGIVVLTGEPGVGKTRLAADALGAAAAIGMRTAAGRCSDADQATPYQPFVHVLEALAASLPAVELRTVLGDDAADVAKVAPGLRRLLPSVGRPAAVPPEQEQRVVLDAVRSFLGRVAGERGLAVVVDDLQWADEATLRLLEHLAEGPVLIVGTAREGGLEPGHPLARTCERLIRRHAWEEIRVAPLAPDAVAAMLDALADGPAPPALSEAVVAQAGGNPFFVEQLYRHLSDGAQTGVPPSVRVVLGHRLQELSTPARRLLDAVAVLGREADVACAVEVAGLGGDAVLDALEAAVAAHLVRVTAVGDSDRITFRHDLVRHALLAELSVPRRRQLHARAADVLERADPAATAGLAGHLLQAGSFVPVERTVSALHRAAQDALGSAAFGEALRLLELAIERSPDERGRAALLADLALAERALGRSDAAIGHWRAALAAFEARADRERAADVCLEICRVLENAGWWAEAAATARRGLSALPEAAARRRVSLLAQLVNCTSFAGVFDDAAAALEDADATAAALAEPEPRARVLTARAMHAFTRAAFSECAAAAGAALDEVERAGDPYWTGMTATLVQRALTAAGRVDEAAAVTARLDGIARRAGHVMVAHAERNAAVLDVLASGDLATFAARTELDLQRCRTGGLRWLADAEAQAGQIAFWRGDVDLALAHFDEAVAREPPGAYRGRYQAPLLRMLAHLGERDAFHRRWAALADCDPTALGGRLTRLAAAEGLAVLGERDAAAALAGSVSDALVGGLVIMPVDLRLVHTVAGLVAADPAAADEHFRAAVAQADALPHLVEAAEARRLWGEVLLDRGEGARARPLLADATGRYRRLGMPGHRAVAEARLAEC
jgi:tetratricopeptide (TPR) repeat protein